MEGDIHFLNVEPIWVTLKENENGGQKVTSVINQCFMKYQKVMIYNLGVGDDFNHFLSALRSHYHIKLIKVDTDLDLCFKRVKERNTTNHITVSDDKVKEYNEIASRVELDWNLIIGNNSQQQPEDIKEKISNL